MRTADLHLNAVRMLETSPCPFCLQITKITAVPPNEVHADVRLLHPFPGLDKYTGFDVRGILITDGDLVFPSSGRIVAFGENTIRLKNADGYTHLFNPTEFPVTLPVPPALRYIPGKYAPLTDLSSTLNPFIAYRADAPRRMFEAGGIETRTFEVIVPEGVFKFGYAVDCSWHPVDGPVTDPLTDFPPEANCMEAYKVDVRIERGLESGGGKSPITVMPLDHQGADTVDSVYIESPQLFDGQIPLPDSIVTIDGNCMFTGSVPNELGAGAGIYPILVRVVDNVVDPNLGPVDAWQLASVEIFRGWARTWGGTGTDVGNTITVESDGTSYTAGSFYGTVDFDPGPDTDIHKATDAHSSYLSKFDSMGSFQWARAWPGAMNSARGVASHDGGDVVIAGSFTGTVDFDPGTGVEEHLGGGLNGYIVKLDSFGNFVWCRTFGGEASVSVKAVAIDANENIYITGSYACIADFDPSEETDQFISNGNADAFLTAYSANGDYRWTRSWGSVDFDEGSDVEVNDSGAVYICGRFQHMVDFDPSEVDVWRTSHGEGDAFLVAYDSSGHLFLADVWGGPEEDCAEDIALGLNGVIYASGFFTSTADLDPSGGGDLRMSNGEEDAFLIALDEFGNALWAETWGGPGSDDAYGVAADSTDHISVTGWFEGSVDMDPGPGTSKKTSNGDEDAFTSMFDPTGAFLWSAAWGSGSSDQGSKVEMDDSSHIYSTGRFSETVDFNPGVGIDERTSHGSCDVFIEKLPLDGLW
jgi:hypothetical protein